MTIVPGQETQSIEEEWKERRQVALNIRRLHPNMRRLFKSWCAMHGVSMESAIEQIIGQIVTREIVPRITASH